MGELAQPCTGNDILGLRTLLKLSAKRPFRNFEIKKMEILYAESSILQQEFLVEIRTKSTEFTQFL